MDDLSADSHDHPGVASSRGWRCRAAEPTCRSGRPVRSPLAFLPGAPPIQKWIHPSANSVGGVWAQTETLPYHAHFVHLDPNVREPLGVPVVRVTYSRGENEHRAGTYVVHRLTDRHPEEDGRQPGLDRTAALPSVPIVLNRHAYGGTRMGNDPGACVADPCPIVHEMRNLAVMGGCTFGSTTGSNPTDTIEAIAWRSAEYSAQTFGRFAMRATAGATKAPGNARGPASAGNVCRRLPPTPG